MIVKGIFNSTPEEQTELLTSADDEYIDLSIPEVINYNFDVKPILSDKCYVCHGPDPRAVQGNLRLDQKTDWYRISE